MGHFEGKGKGKGYKGNSMSVNASLAYSNREMPKSKWTKAAILEHLEKEDRPDLVEKARQLPHYVLITFLRNTSVHHTGALFNQTRFWTFQTDWFANADQADFDNIIAEHKAKNTKTAEERAEANRRAEASRQMKAKKAELEKLFKYSTYKTLNGFLRNVTPELEVELTAKRAEAIRARREQLRASWTKQNHQCGLDQIEDDDFIDSYIRF